MHRDLKPDNILLRSHQTEEGSINSESNYDIVIGDFGLATRYDRDVSKILYKRCGTPGFVAPEILNYDVS
jgi:calcium-dependent protein kinase